MPHLEQRGPRSAPRGTGKESVELKDVRKTARRHFFSVQSRRRDRQCLAGLRWCRRSRERFTVQFTAERKEKFVYARRLGGGRAMNEISDGSHGGVWEYTDLAGTRFPCREHDPWYLPQPCTPSTYGVFLILFCKCCSCGAELLRYIERKSDSLRYVHHSPVNNHHSPAWRERGGSMLTLRRLEKYQLG